MKTHAYIIYDTGEGVLIYECNLTPEELEAVAAVHNVYANTTDSTVEQDNWISNIDTNIADIKKVFDATGGPDGEAVAPLHILKGGMVFVTGYVP